MMHPTHMAREVAEIPQAVARLLDGSALAISAAAAALRAADPDMIVTVARGSSDHAANYLKYAIELTTGIPVASIGPSVSSVYGRKMRVGRAVCIGISQSGRSPDIVEMMRASREGGALTLAVTNFADSPMAMVEMLEPVTPCWSVTGSQRIDAPAVSGTRQFSVFQTPPLAVPT